MQTINVTKVVVHEKKMKQRLKAVKKILLFPNFLHPTLPSLTRLHSKRKPKNKKETMTHHVVFGHVQERRLPMTIHLFHEQALFRTPLQLHAYGLVSTETAVKRVQGSGGVLACLWWCFSPSAFVVALHVLHALNALNALNAVVFVVFVVFVSGIDHHRTGGTVTKR